MALVLIIFSISNRASIDLAFYPFDYVLTVPLYFVLFTGIFIGLIIAASVSGYLQLRGFARRRKAERKATELEEQVSELSEEVHSKRSEEGHRRLEPGNNQISTGTRD